MADSSSTSRGTERFLATDVNALSLVHQSGELDGLDNLSTYNLKLLPFKGVVGQVQSVPEMLNAFGLSSGGHLPNAITVHDYTSNDKHMESNNKGKKRRPISECNGPLPKSPRIKISEDYVPNNVFSNTIKNPKLEDMKKQSSELLHCRSSIKSNVKPAKEISEDDDDPKEAYIHIRAKRGKATNSHSLAERVRREKISERMRILQDLVPGCNKITGKAVMLDEIINYVQSLQQQVEFLSMKLSAVNPELNIDIAQIFSKVARDRTAFLGLGPGFSSSYAHYDGTGQIPSEMLMATTVSQLSSMAQIENIWDEDLQNAIDMTCIPPYVANASRLHGKDSKFG